MENRKNIIKMCLLKHNIISSYLPYSNFVFSDFKEFFLKLDQLEDRIKVFLLFEGWYSEQVELTVEFIDRFNRYFLENDEKGLYKNNQDTIIKNEKRILKILLLFSCELCDDQTNKLRTDLLVEFFLFYVKLIGENDILIVVSFFNQTFTMIQEYIGVMIQFFLCVPDTEKDIILIRKYLDGQVAFVFQQCNYFNSDYLALFDKTFNNQIDVNNTVLNNREVIFNKLFEIITGKKIDYTSEELHIDKSLRNQKLSNVDEKVFAKIINSIPEIYSPKKLCYTYLTGEFGTDDTMKNQGLYEILNETSYVYDDHTHYV